MDSLKKTIKLIQNQLRGQRASSWNKWKLMQMHFESQTSGEEDMTETKATTIKQ